MSDQSRRATLHVLPSLAVAALAILLLSACATMRGGRAANDDAAARYARLEQEAQSLINRRAILDKEFERITRELDVWAKRHKVKVATPQLVLSLLSRSLAAHRPSGKERSGFEREYAEIEHAMARARSERASIERNVTDLKMRLSQFKASPEPFTKTQTYHFGDVFLPIAGLEPTFAARAACESLVWDSMRGICQLTEEHCSARDPEKPSEGWLQFCTYSCHKLDIATTL